MWNWICKHFLGHVQRMRDTELPDGMDWEKLSRLISEQLREENARIQDRMRWNLTFQGFLFATFGILLINAEWEGAAIIGMTGVVVAVLALFGFVSAYANINRIKRNWFRYHENNEAPPDIYQPFSNCFWSLIGRLPVFLICVVLVSAWLILMEAT